MKGNPTSLAVNNAIFKTKIKVFPNPFSSKINIENATENEIYTLTNELGQEIFSGKNIEKQDFSNLAKGIYFLKITYETSKTIKLIKD